MSRPTETLADYVLGSLAPEEARALEAHLEGCAECRERVKRLQATFYALPDALSLQKPPEDAWRKLQARRASLVSPGGAPRRSRRSAFARQTVGRWALAAVCLLLLGSLGWGLKQNQQLTKLGHEQAALAAWMNHPDLTIRPLQGGGDAFPGVICTYPDGRALLVQKDNPPRGMVYRVWGLKGVNRTDLGTTVDRLLPLNTEGFDAFEVGLEPRGDGQPAAQLIGRVSL